MEGHSVECLEKGWGVLVGVRLDVTGWTWPDHVCWQPTEANIAWCASRGAWAAGREGILPLAGETHLQSCLQHWEPSTGRNGASGASPGEAIEMLTGLKHLCSGDRERAGDVQPGGASGGDLRAPSST